MHLTEHNAALSDAFSTVDFKVRFRPANMPIDRIDFENVGEGDLQELVATQVPEGLRVEYKRESYGNADADKREALKDISAFANSQGGHLVIGIETREGLPVALHGVPSLNADAEILRMEQLIRSGIEPRILNVRSKALRLQNGNTALLLRVPRSWNVPHRVCAQNANRFWLRNSSGVHEASMDELRALFTQTTSAIDRVRRFRDERVQTIAAGRGPRPLEGNGRLILHVVPLSATATSSKIDLDLALRNHQAFRPIAASGMSPRFNFEGFINERGGDLNHGYTQLFRNGALEATMAHILRQPDRDAPLRIPGLALERYFFEVFGDYVNGLRNLGVDPPLVVMVTLEGVEGALYAVRANLAFNPIPPLDRPTMLLPDCVIDEYGPTVAYHKAIRPAFDALWNAIGYSASEFFDDAGLWVGEQRRR